MPEIKEMKLLAIGEQKIFECDDAGYNVGQQHCLYSKKFVPVMS